MSVEEDFFEEQTEQSKVKTRIVTKYCRAWSRVLIGYLRKSGKPVHLRFVDLLSGPGRYKDGAASTPIKILELAIGADDLRDSLETIFNDRDYRSELERNITDIPNIDTLRYKAKISGTKLIDESDFYTTAGIDGSDPVPTLYFIDPWGYKEVSRDVISKLIEPFGCDCIFFLNLKRVNAAFGDPTKRQPLDRIFGQKEASELATRLDSAVSTKERHDLILSQLEASLKAGSAKYVTFFRILDEHDNVSHCLVSVSKNPKAFEIMKKIYTGESSGHVAGLFEYKPSEILQPSLLFDNGLGNLKARLLSKFAGERHRFKAIYDSDHVNTNYTQANYREAIAELEEEDKIFVVPSMQQRARGAIITCGPDTMITFPEQTTDGQ
ncbi:MAG: three-Cys-motif partner protein TcmP [Pyrinomonadaceae bacterium]